MFILIVLKCSSVELPISHGNLEHYNSLLSQTSAMADLKELQQQ